jgi:hypothetical protein
MSYLDVPRIHFAGGFWADPSTVNNVDTNFAPSAAPAPLWNPAGTHWFYFDTCTIRSGVDQTGKPLLTSADDPIIGATIESTNIPQFARLVDLDVDWQIASQIWGLSLKINVPGVGDQTGTMVAATMRNLWIRVPGVAGIGPLAATSGAFQSVLTSVVANPPAGPTRSGVLNTWLGASGKLSIKFVLYAFEPKTTSSRFKFGKVVGTIGPADASDPDHFVAARRMEGASNLFAPAPFKVDSTRGKLIVDLGNSIPQSAPGGAPRALGVMQAYVATPGSATPSLVGSPIQYDQAHFETTAGVEEVSLSASQVTQLASNAAVIGVTTRGPILAERPSGAYLDVSETVLRLNPGESRAVTFSATVFGKPKAGQTIGLRLKSSGGAPATSLTFPATVTTDAAGRATATFTGGDPGHPRQDLDGAVYQVAFDWGVTAPGTAPRERGVIVIRVFDRVPAVVSPTWTNVQPILAEYAQLFPSMKQQIDLSTQSMVSAQSSRIKTSLSWDISDPRYMPVTRDLSENKRQILLRWIARGCP